MRLVGESGEQIGVVRTAEALKQAKAAGLDLVEIQPNARPPVCRLMDYGKLKYSLNKKQRASRKTQVKEIKIRYNTDKHDYDLKMKKIITFLSRGDKVKVSMRFRGREMQHRQLGLEVLQKLQHELGDDVVVDSHPSLEGRQLTMLLSASKTLLQRVEQEKAKSKQASEADNAEKSAVKDENTASESEK